MRFIIVIGFLAACAYSFVHFEIMDKVNKVTAEKRNAEYIAAGEALIKEREESFLRDYIPAAGCRNPASELKRVECSNQASMAKRGYIAEWNRKNIYRFPKLPN